jgi:uncharacterized damage-inducible protein DinB
MSWLGGYRADGCVCTEVWLRTLPPILPEGDIAMATSDELMELANHMEWADSIVWEAVLRSEAGRSSDKVRTCLHHILVVQHIFPQIWRGDQPQFPDASQFPDLESLARRSQEGHTQLQRFLAGASPETLARELRLPWAGQMEQTQNRPLKNPTLRQTAVQVVMHSIYHRGQVNTRLRDAGVDPPLTDFIAWVWWGQPPAVWSFLEPASI